MKLTKCELWLKEVRFLGYVISKEGVKVDPVNIKVVVKCETPKKVTEIRCFLGLAGYYRRFVKDFSKIAQPLTHLMRKDCKFFWSKDCEGKFKKLKKSLTSILILTLPSKCVGYKVFSDASKNGLGCVLMQQKKVIAYASM